MTGQTPFGGASKLQYGPILRQTERLGGDPGHTVESARSWRVISA